MDGLNPGELPDTATTMERMCEKLDNLGQRMSAIEAQLQMKVSQGSYN